MRRPGYPGTAVRIGEILYEVVAAEKSGEEWIYRLEPWSGEDTIRVYVDWGEEAEREFSAGLRCARSQRRKDLLAWVSQPFLGFLPAKVQDRLYQERGLEPARATFWSAVLETVIASPFATVFGINLFAGGAAGLGLLLPTWAGLLSVVATAEGVFRLVGVVSTGDAIGSLFLAPFSFRWRSEGPRDVPQDEILAAGDMMTIVSPVPKVWWEKAGGASYKGEPYVLRESGREGMNYIYRFRKGGKGFPILDPALENARNRSSDLSYVFALLWGFLPFDLQTALEFYGRYKPGPYVILSIVFNVLLAFALVGPGLVNVSLGVFELWPLLKLAAALLLFFEGILRLLRLMKDRQASGSILAFLVKPFYALAFKDQPHKKSEAPGMRRA